MLQLLRDKGLDTTAGISVSTDTRNLPAGCVFFALKGERFNGNSYALQALEQGAALAVVDEADCCTDERCILVDNSLRALQTLAREWRREWGKTVIGITGTNGKTTTKELTAAVLQRRYRLHYTQGNLNNHIGVPLTLLQLRNEHELAIVEMGASHKGDIKELVEIAEPDCGLITNVAPAHLQGFGSFEGVMQTKAELYDYLQAHGGYIFRNIDNPYLQQLTAGRPLPCHSYSLLQEAEVQGCVTDCTGLLQMNVMGRPLQTHIMGAYNAENVLAALCVGLHFGVSMAEGMKAVADYVPDNNRSMLLTTEHNTVVVDAYNANPTSMRAAIDNFVGMSVPRNNQVLILGNMGELGEQSGALHQELVELIRSHGFEHVCLVGKEFEQTTSPYPVLADAEAMRQHLNTHPIAGKYILLKGSHSVHLETLLPLL